MSITFRAAATFRDGPTGEVSGKGAEYQTGNWPEQLRGKHLLLSKKEDLDEATSILSLELTAAEESPTATPPTPT